MWQLLQIKSLVNEEGVHGDRRITHLLAYLYNIIAGSRVQVPPEIVILNTIVLPHKDISRSQINRIILWRQVKVIKSAELLFMLFSQLLFIKIPQHWVIVYLYMYNNYPIVRYTIYACHNALLAVSYTETEINFMYASWYLALADNDIAVIAVHINSVAIMGVVGEDYVISAYLHVHTSIVICVIMGPPST